MEYEHAMMLMAKEAGPDVFLPELKKEIDRFLALPPEEKNNIVNRMVLIVALNSGIGCVFPGTKEQLIQTIEKSTFATQILQNLEPKN